MKNSRFNALLANENWGLTRNVLLKNLNPVLSETMGILLDNTRRVLLAENLIQNISYIPKLSFPLVRRAFPNLIAHNIVKVQPMKSPMGAVRFLDSFIEGLDGSLVTTGPMGTYPWGPGDTTYSTPQNLKTKAVLASGTGNTNKIFSGKLDDKFSEGTIFLEINSAADGSGVWTKVAEVDRSGVLFPMSNSNVRVLGSVDPKSLDYVVSFPDITPDKAIRFSYAKDIQKNIPFGSEKTYNTMRFDIKRVPVEAKTRKLGTTYSFETIEDYQAEFNENFEDRMVEYLTTNILSEIDGEILGDLFGLAAHSDTWDAAMPAGWVRGINAWYETIMPKINKLSNTIKQLTHISGATFMVCSPRTATVFQSLQTFVSKGNPAEDAPMSVGSKTEGTVSGMTLYTSPLVDDGKVLLGFNGTKPEETGYVYAPYVPVTLHPIAYSEGMPSVLARTRYATYCLRRDFYAVLNITSL